MPSRDHRTQLRLRLSILSTVVLVLFVALFSRLWYLQVLAGDRYGELAEGNRVRQVVVEAPRGRILDRDSRVLVDNRAAWAVTVKLSEMGDRADEILDRLTQVLHVPRADIDERLELYTGSPLKGVPIAEDVTPEVLYYLTERKEAFPGVELAVVALRTYPHGPLAAHVLGYVGEITGEQLAEDGYQGYRQGDIIGKAGVEQTYDRDIRGRDGYQLMEVDVRGDVVGTLHTQVPQRGNDLQLGVDLDVQKAAEQALAEGLEEARKLADSERGGTYPAPAASAVVLDPNDGSVLAMANLPQYDPRKFVGGISGADFARYNDDPNRPLLNRAVQSTHPPGSTWKPVTALAALQAGVITPSTTFNDPGYFRLGNHVFRGLPPGGLGVVDLATSLIKSSDVYYYNIAAQHAAQETAQEERGQRPSELVQAMARRFGFGRAPGIDLPYAATGTVPDRAWRQRIWEANRQAYCAGHSELQRYLCRDGARWQPGDLVNLSIGQGDLLVSPLQLALGYAALANGGTIPTPHIADAVVASDSGQPVREMTPQAAGQVGAAPEFLGMVADALAGVPREGTAQAAFAGFPTEQVPVAGKTGTAERDNQAPFAWFASFAPADQPRYVVVVMVEQGGFGGQTAAPIARRIYQHLFDLEAH